MKERIRELERQLDRKTLDAESVREALDKSRPKKTNLARAVAVSGQFSVKVVVATLGVFRPKRNLGLRHLRLRGPTGTGDEFFLAATA